MVSYGASYLRAKFSGHRHFVSGDMLLVCHVISQDHVIKIRYILKSTITVYF